MPVRIYLVVILRLIMVKERPLHIDRRRNSLSFGKQLYLEPTSIITDRNEVVAKVIFLHLFVILFTGGGGVCLRQNPSPGSRPPGSYTPPSRQPPGADPPRSRPAPRSRHPLPLGADPPPGSRLPPREQNPAYAQRAAGTHRTGMHSCW